MDEYDFIEYCFDSITSFHSELDDLLNNNTPKSDIDITRLISRYIRFLTRYSDEYVSKSQQIAQASYKLLDSSLYLDHSTLILSHLVRHHALLSNDIDELVIVYSILYYAGKEDARWMIFITAEACHQSNKLFSKLLSELQAYTGGYRLMSISLRLLFEMLKMSSLNLSDLEQISLETINFFLNLIESTSADSEEQFNYEMIQFILILNEQYMMTSVPNKVLDILVRRIGLSDTLAQNLLFMLNRSEDRCIQLLILKLLYGIFTRPDTNDFFFTNDLHVLVDIMLRSLCELSDKDTTLRNSHLRVLKPLLINTPLRQSLYKKREIHQVICSLITPCLYKPVKHSTKALVKEILEDWWEVVCNKPVAPILGVHVKHGIIESGRGENAVILSAPPSNTSSDTEAATTQDPPLDPSLLCV